jgi:excisionase family DNA binding protein
VKEKQPPTPELRLLRAEEVAEMLNVRVSTVYEWARINYIPHIILGIGEKKPCVRFEDGAIRKWIFERSKPGRTNRIPELLRTS